MSLSHAFSPFSTHTYPSTFNAHISVQPRCKDFLSPVLSRNLLFTSAADTQRSRPCWKSLNKPPLLSVFTQTLSRRSRVCVRLSTASWILILRCVMMTASTSVWCVGKRRFPSIGGGRLEQHADAYTRYMSSKRPAKPTEAPLRPHPASIATSEGRKLGKPFRPAMSVLCLTCRTARRNNTAALSRHYVRGRRLPLCPSAHINIYLNFTLQSFFIRDQRVMGIKCKCSSWPTVYNNSTPNLENWVKAIRECDEASVFTAFLQVWATWKKTRQEVTSEEPLCPPG